MIQVQQPQQRLPMPDGARVILETRKHGFKPRETVIVSFIGETDWEGPHVHCLSGKAYDWEWSRDLNMAIVMVPGCDVTNALRGCFWPLASDFLTLIDAEQCRVSYVLKMLPKPELWHLRDVSAYFPNGVVTCN